LSEDEILDNRRGTSDKPRVAAALTFARKIVQTRGQVSDQDLAVLREHGFSEGEIAEIIANVALNIFTNYFNIAAGTEIDFPKAPALAA
jgi:alkylhydroperoxidase family enzyme